MSFFLKSNRHAHVRALCLALSARIVKLADVFDALTTKRPYKEPWTMEEAVAQIELQAGGAFDPAIVAEFKKLFDNGTLARIKAAYC